MLVLQVDAARDGAAQGAGPFRRHYLPLSHLISSRHGSAPPPPQFHRCILTPPVKFTSELGAQAGFADAGGGAFQDLVDKVVVQLPGATGLPSTLMKGSCSTVWFVGKFISFSWQVNEFQEVRRPVRTLSGVFNEAARVPSVVRPPCTRRWLWSCRAPLVSPQP